MRRGSGRRAAGQRAAAYDERPYRGPRQRRDPGTGWAPGDTEPPGCLRSAGAVPKFLAFTVAALLLGGMGIEALVPGADLPVTHSAEFSHISCKRVKNSKGYETWRCWGESPQQVVDNGLANAAPHDPGSVAGRVKTELDYTPYDGGTVPERVRARQTPLLGGWVVPGAEPVLFGGFMMMVAGGCVWFASQPLGKALERRSARTFGYRSH